MKAVLMSGSPSLDRVYAPKQRARLRGLVSLREEIITSVEQVESADLTDIEVIFSTWGMLALTEEQIKRYLPSLKAVFYGAGSVQYFARPFLNCGVRVYSAWHANAVPVVQYTLAQILLSTKGYFRAQPMTRVSRAEAFAFSQNYPGNYDVRIGLLGCGAIGSKVAEMLRPMDFEVLVFDPFLSESRAAELGVQRAEMDEIFKTCFVVSNHLANLPETVGIIKREYLLSMLPYATFINTGRGPQLDENDLYDMLTADPTRTALLDVLTDEQNSDTNRLNTLPNCYITPHFAGAIGQEVRRMGEYMCNAYELFAADKPCSYEVSLEMLKTMA